jgi:hypothetical protein
MFVIIKLSLVMQWNVSPHSNSKKCLLIGANRKICQMLGRAYWYTVFAEHNYIFLMQRCYFISICTRSTLWHFQKCLQCILDSPSPKMFFDIMMMITTTFIVFWVPLTSTMLGTLNPLSLIIPTLQVNMAKR